MRIYTRKGDDGTTGLLFGGRVSKDSSRIETNGAVDEAQAALGVARAEAPQGSELDDLLVGLERDLYVLMAEVATAPQNRRKLTPGTSLVTPEMVDALEARIDQLSERMTMPTEFVIPGANRISAALDVARTAVRRAERVAVSEPVEG
jgi:cob(I)alamin adenosyltransferase